MILLGGSRRTGEFQGKERQGASLFHFVGMPAIMNTLLNFLVSINRGMKIHQFIDAEHSGKSPLRGVTSYIGTNGQMHGNDELSTLWNWSWYTLRTDIWRICLK